jgi:hypothetical protein
MVPAYKNLSVEELVDLLAQKTQVFTHLMAEKNFSEEYKETKAAIQHILSEIESRKETSKSQNMQTEQMNPES